MMKKLLPILFALVFISGLAFATPAVTHTSPTANSTVWGGQSVTIYFSLIDDNYQYTVAPPATLALYWSSTPGARQNLIVNDTNLQNGLVIRCSDYNFAKSTDCNYTATVPGNDVLPIGRYYVDYNFGAKVGAGITGTFGSSGAINVNQPMPSTMQTMIALALFICAAALAVFFVMRVAKGETTAGTALGVAIAVIVLLIVGWTLYSVAVVPI